MYQASPRPVKHPWQLLAVRRFAFTVTIWHLQLCSHFLIFFL